MSTSPRPAPTGSPPTQLRRPQFGSVGLRLPVLVVALYDEVLALLRDNREKLDNLAHALLARDARGAGGLPGRGRRAAATRRAVGAAGAGAT